MTSLPRYTEIFHSAGQSLSTCSCLEPRRATAGWASRPASGPSTPVRRPPSERSVSGASSGEDGSDDELTRTNALFERLVAGRETESGEAPPPYDVAVRAVSFSVRSP